MSSLLTVTGYWPLASGDWLLVTCQRILRIKIRAIEGNRSDKDLIGKDSATRIKLPEASSKKRAATSN